MNCAARGVLTHYLSLDTRSYETDDYPRALALGRVLPRTWRTIQHLTSRAGTFALRPPRMGYRTYVCADKAPMLSPLFGFGHNQVGIHAAAGVWQSARGAGLL